MITAIIQARMGSERLPGKSLMKIKGKSLIWHVANRLKESKYIEKIIIATSNMEIDKPILKEAKEIGVESFAGSENDVLDRFYKAAKKSKSDVIVRITGDCPLIDPEIVDINIQKFLEKKYDYAHSGLSYPDGVGDCEVFSFESLEKAWKKSDELDREHVTPYIWKNPSLFRIWTIENDRDLSEYILSVDEKSQLEAIKKIYSALYDSKKNNIFHLNSIISYIKKNPEIYKMTRKIERRCPDTLIRQQKDLKAKRFQKSTKILKKAKILTPCASQTYSKSYSYFCEGAAPAFLEKGKGSHVWDIDGNEYIDFVSALGAITVGYCNEEINDAIAKQLKKGIAFSQPTTLEVELAEKLSKIVPSAEMIRFLKNGSDATTAAIRLARAYTKKEIIAVCGYHGYQDWYIGSTDNNKGVPEAVNKLTVKFEYNNIDSLKKIFEKNNNLIAAVILEPVQENGPNQGFLEAVKKVTHDNNALLIYDEVVTCFRIDLSGAQGMYGIIPDITALGKGLGNGMPISAVVGKKEILRQIEEGVFISTTHGGEALSLAAAIATLKILEKKETYPYLWMLGKKARDGMNRLIEAKELNKAVELVGLDVHFAPVFKSSGRLTNYDLLSVFQQTMIEEGILVLTTLTLSLSHTKEDIESYLSAADKALDKVKLAIDRNSVDNILFGGKFNPIFKRGKDR